MRSPTIGSDRGLYVGDELVSTVSHHWFTMRIRGTDHAVGGVSSVSTPPHHRRKGYSKRLLAESLREYRDHGEEFAALWPFDYGFYRSLGWERDGELRGYLVYDIRDTGDDRVLSVRELAFCDHEAYTELIRFCRSHDSQVDSVTIHGPDGTILHDLAADPREIEIEAHPGAMIRVVDVERTLSALSYSSDGSAVLGVSDDLAPWNDGRFRLVVENGQATCEPTTAQPNATVDVATLSQIAVGYLSVERARLVSDLDVESEDGVETLSTLFPEEETYLREGF